VTDLSLPRISHAARLTGHAVDALLSHLTDVTKPLRNVAIHTNADVDSIGISTDLPDDPWLARRTANLANAISASPALAAVAMSRKGSMRAERGIGRQGRPARGMAGVFSALTITGRATLAADLAAADAAGLPVPVRDALAARLRLLAPADDGALDRVVRTLVYSGPDEQHTTVELGTLASPELATRAATAPSIVGLDPDEIRTLQAVHAAIDPQPWVRIGATRSMVLPGFTLAYADLGIDEVLALAGQFSDRGVQRMQEFLAGLGGSRISSLDITFGARELGPLWLTVRL
jgi:hypothetical protein